jgi:mannose-6-phosphate isomerase-like protein (cupin superfamily)
MGHHAVGTARITALDADGKSFVADVKVYFSDWSSRATEADQEAAAGTLGKSPSDFAFRTMEMPPTKRTKGGEVRIVDSSKFKVSTAVAMAMVTVRPGGLRELHWHPNADEWQYYISGKGRMTVAATGNRARTMDFQAGDVGYVEKSAALHREYGEYRPDLPGDVQEQLLSGRFALGVAGPYAAGACHGAPANRSGDVRRYSEGWGRSNAGLVDNF